MTGLTSREIGTVAPAARRVSRDLKTPYSRETQSLNHVYRSKTRNHRRI